MKNILNKILLLSAVGLLSGCNPEYTCGNFPEEGCKPVSSVYEETNDGVNDYRREFYSNNDDCEDCDDVDEPPTTSNTRKKGRSINVSLVDTARPGNAIIKPAEVRRILLNTWEDMEGDLHSGEFVYIKLGEMEWVSSSK